CSRSQTAAMAQAKTGFKDTSTTELATVVKRRDAIQDQKWEARRRPASAINGSGERGAVLSTETEGTARCSRLPRRAKNPVTGRVSVRRQNAIASAGATANRTMGPAYVVASTAMMSTRRGDMGA